MKIMTKLYAALFLAPLVLSGGCSKKDATAGTTMAAGTPAVDNTKTAVDNTKEAVKGTAVDTKEGVKEAAIDTKSAAAKKDPAIDTKPAVDNKEGADAIAKAPVDNTKAAVDTGEAIKPKEAAVDMKAGEGADVIAQAPIDNTKAAVDNGEGHMPKKAAVGMNTSKQVKARSTMAMHQGKDAADMNTTRRVRKAILADQSLSSEARHVKVTTANGVLMLRGSVKSDAERDDLGTRALKLAGKNRVENQLEVVAAN
jgi:hypothetical protein